MNALTPKAAALVNEMIAAGWQVRFRADGTLREWEFNKLVKTPDAGEFWRIGLDADIFVAAKDALKHEKGE